MTWNKKSESSYVFFLFVIILFLVIVAISIPAVQKEFGMTIQEFNIESALSPDDASIFSCKTCTTLFKLIVWDWTLPIYLSIFLIIIKVILVVLIWIIIIPTKG